MICVFQGVQTSGVVKNSMKGIPRGEKKNKNKAVSWTIFVWREVTIVGNVYPRIPGFVKDLSEENIPEFTGREAQQDDRQAGFGKGKKKKKKDEIPSTSLLTADPSSSP